jgi:hypothetical protein
MRSRLIRLVVCAVMAVSALGVMSGPALAAGWYWAGSFNHLDRCREEGRKAVNAAPVGNLNWVKYQCRYHDPLFGDPWWSLHLYDN